MILQILQTVLKNERNARIGMWLTKSLPHMVLSYYCVKYANFLLILNNWMIARQTSLNVHETMIEKHHLFHI